jgi:hypothetical protein
MVNTWSTHGQRLVNGWSTIGRRLTLWGCNQCQAVKRKQLRSRRVVPPGREGSLFLQLQPLQWRTPSLDRVASPSAVCGAVAARGGAKLGNNGGDARLRQKGRLMNPTEQQQQATQRGWRARTWILGLNAFGFRSKMPSTACCRTASFSWLLKQFRQLQLSQ